ncbi:MAG: tRNA 2-thiocytidine(32) synthetase TtcA [Myxococcales bacterium]|nr:tRNA 2-thiocytidine(32) synthetase TtcA [Myxococcales bacterium]
MTTSLPVIPSAPTAPKLALGQLESGAAPAAPLRMKIPDDPAKLEKRIAYLVTKATHDYDMLEEGDKVMVCMSGGKDSYALLHFLQRAQRRAPFNFEIVAVHLDQGHPGFPLDTLENYLKNCGSPYEIIHEHTYDVVLSKLEPGKTTCSLCSRLRRGILYSAAKRLGCTKVALGHHRDDILATFMLNFFFCGQLKAMPAKLMSDDGANVLIRPLSYVPEKMIIAYAGHQPWPLIPCSLCSRQEDLKRAQMEQLLGQIDDVYPGALPSALNAMKNLHPRFLLDRKQFDFNTRLTDTADDQLDAFS